MWPLHGLKGSTKVFSTGCTAISVLAPGTPSPLSLPSCGFLQGCFPSHFFSLLSPSCHSAPFILFKIIFHRGTTSIIQLWSSRPGPSWTLNLLKFALSDIYISDLFSIVSIVSGLFSQKSLLQTHHYQKFVV